MSVLAALPIAGQEPSPEPSPSPSPAKPGKAELGEKAEAASDEIRIRAERQGGDPLHSWARGFVDLRAGEMRVQSDAADIYEFTRPDGSKGRKAVFAGNVVFMRDQERISGERLTYDLDSGEGVFENASGYVEPGVLVEARSIERKDAEHYRIEGGRFTSCTQPSPRWSFTASSANVHVDDKVVAKNAVFWVKQVPSFYTPIFVYPIREDQRSTGFLFPHFGSSSLRGFEVGSGFFWAMGRSADQTFYFDHYSKFGWGYGHEFRYALESPSRGDFRTYAFNRDGAGELDYDIQWNAVQYLPLKTKFAVNVRRFSNALFQERFQDSLNLASSRTQRGNISLQRSFGRVANVQFTAEDNRTFFSDQERINKRLPSLRINRSPQRLGRSELVLGFEARAEQLTRGNVNAGVERLGNYSRLDVGPELQYPMSTTYLTVTPRAEARYTRWSATRINSLEVEEGTPISRRYFEGGIDVEGPYLAKVFSNPGKLYSEKFKHVIGPEVRWRYRTPVDDFSSIPKFDGIDQVLGTNEVDYSLVQRLFAKRPGSGGKLQPYELFTWTIGQTYYVQIREGQNDFDPNYSSGAFGPGGTPDHNSPVRSRMRLKPTPALSANFDLEYDVNFRQLRTMTLGTALRKARAGIQANWSRARRLAIDPSERELRRDTYRAQGYFGLLPGKLTFDGGFDYDALRRELIQSRERLRWDVQCCGFILEAIQYNFNSRQDRQIRFSIELANLGAIGNFLGDDPNGRNQGLGGSR